MKKNKNVKLFLKELREICKDNNIELRLIDKYSIRQDGVAIGGSFGGIRKMVLSSSTARPDWLHILVHEASHVDQYLYAHDEMWVAKGDSYDNLDDWLHFKKTYNIDKHINNVQDLELDCEKRAVLKIMANNLPIDHREYIQRANAYVYFFQYLKTSRRWPNSKKSPYSLPEIWKNMPTKFLKTYQYRKLPKKYFKLYQTYL